MEEAERDRKVTKKYRRERKFKTKFYNTSVIKKNSQKKSIYMYKKKVNNFRDIIMNLKI